jgi:peroxiredoxin
MPMKPTLLSAALLILAVAAGRAGDKTPIAWADLPAVDGKTHSLADLKDKAVVVVAITRDRCPMAVKYFQKMNEFVAAEPAAALVAVNLEDGDSLDSMNRVARDRGFKFPYLRDASQDLGRKLGAVGTPEFFVLNKDREVVYRGAWDDGLPVGKVKDRYVEEAVKAALAGRTPAIAETKPVGCSISYRDAR